MKIWPQLKSSSVTTLAAFMSLRSDHFAVPLVATRGHTAALPCCWDMSSERSHEVSLCSDSGEGLKGLNLKVGCVEWVVSE